MNKTTCFIHAIFWFGVGLFSMYKYNKHQDYLDISIEAKVRGHALYLLSTSQQFNYEIVDVLTSVKEEDSRFGWFILRAENNYEVEFHPFMWEMTNIDSDTPKIQIISPRQGRK